jgi:DAHL domain
VKLKCAIAAVPLLLLLLFTWLSLRGMNPEAEMFDRALATLDSFVLKESALQRDILAARSGLLRNYDPLARETDALADAVEQLRVITADARLAPAIKSLSVSLDQQGQLIE